MPGFITAEPHFLVRSPSRFVVLRNSWPAQNLATQVIRTANIKYRGREGTHEYGRETLAGLPEAKWGVPIGHQAGAFGRAARRAHAADKCVNRAIARVGRSLENLGVLAEHGLDKRQLMAAAHNVVPLAAYAQNLKRVKQTKAPAPKAERWPPARSWRNRNMRSASNRLPRCCVRSWRHLIS